MPYRWHFNVVLQRIVVFINEFSTQLIRIFRRCLPQERGEIVIEWSFPSALEINETRIALRVYHHIASLEIAIQKAVGLFCRKVLGKESEVCLQLEFVEVEFRWFQKTILEIVKVEQYTVYVEFRLRIAVRPVKSICALHLYCRQLTNCLHEQLLFHLVVSAASLSSAADGIIERRSSEVGLQISQFVVGNCQHLRHWKFHFPKMACQMDKGMVFVAARANDTDYGFTVIIGKPVILAVASCPRNLLYIGRFAARIFCIKFRQFFHTPTKVRKKMLQNKVFRKFCFRYAFYYIKRQIRKFIIYIIRR